MLQNVSGTLGIVNYMESALNAKINLFLQDYKGVKSVYSWVTKENVPRFSARKRDGRDSKQSSSQISNRKNTHDLLFFYPGSVNLSTNTTRPSRILILPKILSPIFPKKQSSLQCIFLMLPKLPKKTHTHKHIYTRGTHIGCGWYERDHFFILHSYKIDLLSVLNSTKNDRIPF